MLGRLTKVLARTIDEIPPQVMRLLENYDWPGNVRELENVLQRAIIQSAGTTLTLDDGWKPAEPPSAIPAMRLVDIERQHIMSVLDRTHWRIEGYAGAASLLGLKASTLRSRLLKLGIERPHSS
jgi:formate hydrogenlyase transcriptional activator